MLGRIALAGPGGLSQTASMIAYLLGGYAVVMVLAQPRLSPVYSRLFPRILTWPGQRRSPVTGTTTETGVVTKPSPRSVAGTAAKLTGMIDAKGMRLFALIDQREEAQHAGLDLRETILVIFGSPAAGTPVMAASPLAALDLPLKVLVWDDEGQTKVSYYSPDELSARHHLSPELAANLAGISALTEALVAP